MRVGPKDVLLLVDIQNDFMPGGALAVEDGDKILTPLNSVMPKFPLIVASQDWHPVNHMSFIERGGSWPPHCLQGSVGADFHPGLDQSRLQLIIRKGFNPDLEQYSCFHHSPLADMLKGWGIEKLFVGGLATDYCVHDTVMDAARAGLDVFLLTDCVGAVNVNPGDEERALEDMATVSEAVTSGRLE